MEEEEDRGLRMDKGILRYEKGGLRVKWSGLRKDERDLRIVQLGTKAEH